MKIEDPIQIIGVKGWCLNLLQCTVEFITYLYIRGKNLTWIDSRGCMVYMALDMQHMVITPPDVQV